MVSLLKLAEITEVNTYISQNAPRDTADTSFAAGRR